MKTKKLNLYKEDVDILTLLSDVKNRKDLKKIDIISTYLKEIKKQNNIDENKISNILKILSKDGYYKVTTDTSKLTPNSIEYYSLTKFFKIIGQRAIYTILFPELILI